MSRVKVSLRLKWVHREGPGSINCPVFIIEEAPGIWWHML